MGSGKFVRYLWITAIVLGTIAVLGEYKLVVIKGLSNYNFELLLACLILLVIKHFIKTKS